MNRFLESVESFNSKYASIEINGELNSLSFSFWSISEIEDGKKLRTDWDVPPNLIPFYGDWHDIFCIDINDHQILSLNDQREIVHTWVTTKEFVSALSEKEVELTKKPTLVSMTLSPELEAKINAFKNKST